MPISDVSQSASFTNVSRSISITIFDERLQALKPHGYETELVIPRDPTLSLPDFTLHNVTGNRDYFHYHLVDLNHLAPRLSYSIHLDMIPEDLNLSYLMIYKFNAKKIFNSADIIDGWTVFCSASKFRHPTFSLCGYFLRPWNRCIVVGSCLSISDQSIFESNT